MVNPMPKYVGSNTLSGAEKGLIGEYEVYLNPLVWGEGNVHVLGGGSSYVASDRLSVRPGLAPRRRGGA
jgi:hypothetical protein